MDPISAVSFAGMILQFIDFASKLVVGTYEVYRSTGGTTAENVHITAIVNNLNIVTGEMDSDILGNTKHEKALKVLALKCEALSQNLLTVLEKLKVSDKNSAWQSLRVKWASMRKGDELQNIERRLWKYRSQILLRLTLMLGDQQSIVKGQLDFMQSEGERLSTESAARLSKVRKDILKAVERSMKNQKEDHGTAPVVQDQTHLSQAHPVPIEDAQPLPELQDLKSFLERLSSIMAVMPLENRILENLSFESMYHREVTIHDAEIGTLKWFLQGVDNSKDSSDDQNGDATLVMDEQHNGHDLRHDRQRKVFEEERGKRDVARSSFLKWLQTSNGVFHISGKAGSGKSTLMKFLCNHSKTGEELSVWAGSKKLVFARFFFWKAGHDLQKSLQGLYRSLLFEVLSKCPELIPQVFPSQCNVLNNKTVSKAIDSTLFRPSHLEEAFRNLIRHTEFPAHRFCLFIDGLDEYDGDSVDHQVLADGLRTWENGDDIKICVSSRPYIESHTIFSDPPDQRIHLHELTSHDIYLYSRQMLENASNSECIPNEYLYLVQDVVRMSEGVFLWAWLVIRSMIPQILRGDPFKELQSTLNTIPRELDALYSQLLDSLQPHDQQRAAQMLLLVADDKSHIPLNSVAFCWLDNLQVPEFPSLDAISSFTPARLQEVMAIVDRQVQSIIKGVLELMLLADEYDGLKSIGVRRCQFFHRTARDFVLNHPRLGHIIDIQTISTSENLHRL
ncbi:hypothetical protein BDW59DRAFT_153888 [Aspergillus cavernicola]|uniref:NACHT domain-containing protein n=1 Tax=Aspergillus cavernicola TaxID=176166 RepID=A0ABR4HJ06_9EURO